jgi:transposase
MVWRENVYSKLIKAAKNALEIGIPSSIGFSKISIIISLLESIREQIDRVVLKIEDLMDSGNISEEFKKNFEIIKTLPGSGFISALTVLAEMSNFNHFSKPKKLTNLFFIYIFYSI